MGWWQVAFWVVSMVVSYALTPKPEQPRAASLQDFRVPTADQTRPIPVVFGTRWITGPNVVWYGDLAARPIRKKGGKK